MKHRNIGRITVLFIFITYLTGFFLADNWRNTMKYGDSSGYYIHTVSFLLHHDVGDYTKTLESFFKHIPEASNLLDDPFWLRDTQIGKKAIKYPVGIAIMETPAFLVAHLYATFNNQYENDGWSSPYIFAVNFIQLLYVSIAFYLLFCVLKFYFDLRTTLLTIVSLALGTNLLIQACFLTMAHTFQFFNFSLLIFLTHHFYRKPSLQKAVLIGLSVGLIGMCRIPEIIAFLVPLFWGVYNKSTLLKRIKFIKNKYAYFLVAGIGTLLMFSPQLYYWYYVSGDFIYNSYGGEGFDFSNPQITKGWLSYKNGWLVYTPLMILSLVGVFMLKRKIPEILLPLVLFVGLSAYIHYSYYQWNYFPGLGSRPMIDSYPLLSFSLASFIGYISTKNIGKVIAVFLVFLFMFLNIFQTWQSKAGIIISERANNAFFWESFLKTDHSRESLITFDTSEPQPSSNNIHFDKTVYYNDFEDERYSDEKAFAGKRSFKVNTMFPDSPSTFDFKTFGIEGGDYLKIFLMGFVEKEHFIPSFDGHERITTVIYDSKGKQRRYRGLSVQTYIGNEDNSIWNHGKVEVWDSVSYYIHIPKQANGEWYFESFISNPSSKQFFIDEYRIDLYKKN